MSRRSSTMRIAGALAAAALAIASATASAQYRDDPRDWRHGPDGGQGRGYGRGPGGPGYDRGQDYDRGPGSDRGPGRREPDGYSRRGDPRQGYYARHHRCRDSGTGGTIIGAIAGGLLGNSIAGYGDRAAGTIIGGGAGALAGRALDRDC